MNNTADTVSMVHLAEALKQIEARKKISGEQRFFEPFDASQCIALEPNARQVHFNKKPLSQIRCGDMLMFWSGPHAKPRIWPSLACVK
jgi:hypothetical protein